MTTAYDHGGRAALITGLAALQLSSAEAEFLARVKPAGIILFARNCASHDQIKTLIDAAKTAIGAAGLLVLIDQEGGRVQRLRPPLGRDLPPARTYGRMFAENPQTACAAVFDIHRLLARDLRALGINTDCLPVLDVPVEGAHDIIGDRAFARDPGTIATLGKAAADGLMAGGVLPVMKHIPGHGRACVDSHLALPVVDASRSQLEATDFAPFAQLRALPAAMTAHVVFNALDPERPASTSPEVIKQIIRDAMGFDGLLMSDDLSMKALDGDIGARARAVIAAGSDVALHCNGELAEMEDAAANVPQLADEAAWRFEVCLACVSEEPETLDDRALASAEHSLAAALELAARPPLSV